MDYTSVTELPGQKASKEQLGRLFNRYHFASQFCLGKDVLEVACGAGIGLGYLAKVATRVVAGDLDKGNLEFALKQYQGRTGIELGKLDAGNLPFGEGTFDVIICYEAIYYLKEPSRFISEARRVLRDGGIIILCTVNLDWPDFNPSPYSVRYFSVPDLYILLKDRFKTIEMFGAFASNFNTVKCQFLSFMKRLAIVIGIMPKTMNGKALLKRVFFGELVRLPEELNGTSFEYVPPVPIPHESPNFVYKVLYAVAWLDKNAGQF